MKTMKTLTAALALAAGAAFTTEATAANEIFLTNQIINGLNSPVDVAVMSHPGANQSGLFIVEQGTNSIVRYKLDQTGAVILSSKFTFPVVSGLTPRAVAVNDIKGHVNYGQVYVASGDGLGTYSMIEAYLPNGTLWACNVANFPYSLQKVTALAVDREGDVYAADEKSKLSFRFDFGYFTPSQCALMDPTATYKPFMGAPGDITVTESGLVLHVGLCGCLMASNRDGTDFWNRNIGVPQIGASSIDGHDLAEKLWTCTGDALTFASSSAFRRVFANCYANNGQGHANDGNTSAIGAGALVNARRVEARCFWDEKWTFSNGWSARSFERVFVAEPSGNRVATYLVSHTSYIRPPSIVAWWRFEENGGQCIDSINGNTGVFPFSSAPLRTEGFVRKGLTFSSADDGVGVTDHPTLDFGNGDYSVECWIRSCSNVGVRSIVEKRQMISGAPVGYALYLYNGTIGFQIAANGTWWNFIPPSTGGAANGDWHHLAATIARGPNVITLYVDGNVVLSAPIPAAVQGNIDNGADLLIGSHPFSGPSAAIEGEVDEVSLYGSCLSAIEVQAIATARCAGKRIQ